MCWQIVFLRNTFLLRWVIFSHKFFNLMNIITCYKKLSYLFWRSFNFFILFSLSFSIFCLIERVFKRFWIVLNRQLPNVKMQNYFFFLKLVSCSYMFPTHYIFSYMLTMVFFLNYSKLFHLLYLRNDLFQSNEARLFTLICKYKMRVPSAFANLIRNLTSRHLKRYF